VLEGHPCKGPLWAQHNLEGSFQEIFTWKEIMEFQVLPLLAFRGIYTTWNEKYFIIGVPLLLESLYVC